MTPLDWNTLAIMGSVLGTGAGGAWWLRGELSKVKALIHSEMKEHRKDDARQFQDHMLRIQKLELRTFGFTHSGDSDLNQL